MTHVHSADTSIQSSAAKIHAPDSIFSSVEFRRCLHVVQILERLETEVGLKYQAIPRETVGSSAAAALRNPGLGLFLTNFVGEKKGTL